MLQFAVRMRTSTDRTGCTNFFREKMHFLRAGLTKGRCTQFALWFLVLARINLIPATFKVTGVPKMGTSVKPVSLAASRQEIFWTLCRLCRALAPPIGEVLGGLGQFGRSFCCQGSGMKDISEGFRGKPLICSLLGSDMFSFCL